MIKKLHYGLAKQMHEYTSLQDYVQLGQKCTDKEARARSVPVENNYEMPGFAIELRDVCFTYPNQEEDNKQVLRNLSVSIPPGALVAVVGYNGASAFSQARASRTDPALYRLANLV